MKSLLKILFVSVAMVVAGCGEGVEGDVAAQEQLAAAPDVAAEGGEQVGEVGQVEQKLCSPPGTSPWAVVYFYSKVNYPLNVYWVNQYCQEVYVGQMAAYGSMGSNTSVGHVFRFRNAWNNNAFIYEYGGAPNSGYFYVNVPY